MSDGEGDEDYDEVLDQQVQRLTVMARFARAVIELPWFSRLGEPLSADEKEIAESYLAAAGFPDAAVATVADWSDAELVAENPDWNTDWWEAEEQLKATLIDRALQHIDEAELMNALNHLAAQCAGVALDAVGNAAIDAGYRPETGQDEESFLNAAAGWAVAGAYQAALVLAAGADEDHPFAIKFRLFEHGRLPLGIAGSTFSIF